MLSGIISLAASVIGFFKGLLDRRREEAIRQAGRLEQQSADQAVAIEAQRRMDEAAAKPRGSTQDAFDEGKF
jgi:hypothetical protein